MNKLYGVLVKLHKLPFSSKKLNSCKRLSTYDPEKTPRQLNIRMIG